MTIGVIGLLLGAFYILVRGVVDFLKGRDAANSTKKITLLDTIIQSKNLDIAKDEQDVKEKSDVYEGMRRNTPHND